MRICITGLRGVPGVMGGVESHCEQLYPRVKRLRPDFDITVIGRKTYIPDGRTRHQGVDVVALPSLRTKSLETISNTLLAVLYARFRLKAELIHMHNVGPALVAPLARLLGMKVVVTYHSKNYEHQKWGGFAKAMLRIGERFALMSSNRLIVVSRSVTEELKRRYPSRADRIAHIPNGAPDFSAVEAGDDTELLQGFGLTKGGYVIAVGRLVPEKSFQTLLEAFKRAKPPFKLAIVGRADHEDDYSRGLMSYADDQIRFLGFQSHAVLGRLYRNASLFVLPSVNEGLPISALEAITLNVPVLMSDIQPNVDIGLKPENYFPVGDVDALRRKLLQDHETYRVNAAAIMPNFDWTAIAHATEQTFDQANRR
jgi:glycosyltransferase involved in cell wall biosynthesis